MPKPLAKTTHEQKNNLSAISKFMSEN